MITLYHGIYLEDYKLMMQRGYLLHDRAEGMSPCVYLTPDFEEAKCYGDIVLEIELEENNPVFKDSNYSKDCWQARFYSKIDIKYIDIKFIRNETIMNIYKEGFEDESKGKFNSNCYNYNLLMKVYTLGRIHYILGDDLSDIDFYSIDQITKEIKNE